MPVIYALDRQGKLQWLRHDGATNFTPNWTGPVEIGHGFNDRSYAGAFGYENVIYLLQRNGRLRWFLDKDPNSPGDVIGGSDEISRGWAGVKSVLAAPRGVVYSITHDGILRWHKYLGYQTGLGGWEADRALGTVSYGWHHYKQVFAGRHPDPNKQQTDLAIFALRFDGRLEMYTHTDFSAKPPGAISGPQEIGRGWQSLRILLCEGKYFYSLREDGSMVLLRLEPKAPVGEWKQKTDSSGQHIPIGQFEFTPTGGANPIDHDWLAYRSLIGGDYSGFPVCQVRDFSQQRLTRIPFNSRAHSWNPFLRTTVAFHPATNQPFIRTWNSERMAELVKRVRSGDGAWELLQPLMRAVYNSPLSEQWEGAYDAMQKESGLVFDPAGSAYLSLDGLERNLAPQIGISMLTYVEARKAWNVYNLSKLPATAIVAGSVFTPVKYLRFEAFTGCNESLPIPTIVGATQRYRDNGHAVNPTEASRRNLFLIFFERDEDGELHSFRSTRFVPGTADGAASVDRDHATTLGDDSANVTATHRGRTHVIWPYPGRKDTRLVHFAANTYDHTSGRFLYERSVHVGTVDSGRSFKESYGAHEIPWADDHCYPTIAVGPDGLLHCVLGSHNGACKYLQSVAPANVSAWTDMSDTLGQISGTYPSLACDRDGMLHLLLRQNVSTVFEDGRYRLTYMRGMRDQLGAVQWERRKLIEIMFSAYAIFYHSLRIDYRGRLFVAASFGTNAGIEQETTLMISDDSGSTWRYCTTQDLIDGM